MDAKKDSEFLRWVATTKVRVGAGAVSEKLREIARTVENLGEFAEGMAAIADEFDHYLHHPAVRAAVKVYGACKEVQAAREGE